MSATPVPPTAAGPDKLKALLATVVKKSGFPFQAKVASVIDSVPGWEVVGMEKPWSHGDREEFLDIVARKHNVHLTIECKKTSALPSDAKKSGVDWFAGAPKRAYAFLREEPDKVPLAPKTLTLCTAFADPNEAAEPDAPEGTYATWWNLAPASYEAALCVTVDVEQKDMLEHEVATLVRGTHQYADALYRFLWGVGAQITEVFLPVFVTTAPLFVVKLNLDNVAIESGEYVLDPSELEQVPWIRFTKAFMADNTTGIAERTVVVVQAEHVKTFLEAFAVLPMPDPTA